ncbi:MAG: hypothetical protein EPO11_01035 [Gammaproteobacteria bacterium]|nr:MAG: hypothetical protein EPO11_01035 [Gammaproteobacteria bacterium]
MNIRKSSQSILGVTLLEIMLVLAIASLIIVMSVRYYQSANQNSQANTFVSQVGAITAALENLTQGTGSYNSVTADQLQALLPANTLTGTPWGGTASFQSTDTGYKLTVTTAKGTAGSPMGGTGLCGLISAKLLQDSHYTFTCSVVTYTANV